MAVVKESTSRYEQKRLSRIESGIRAAQQSGISLNQMKQIVRKVYSKKRHAVEEGNITRPNVNKWDGEVFNGEKDEDKAQKHVVLPKDTYEQFEGRRSQRFSRPVTKMFLEHPERLEQYNVLRDHRFSRFMAIDIVTKAFNRTVDNNGGHQENSTEDRHSLDLTTHGWQKFMKEHKALFTKMYDLRKQESLNHLQAINSIFKDMDQVYKATNGKSVSDQIKEISKQIDLANKDKSTPDFKAKEWKPVLKRRYYQIFDQVR